MTRTWHGSCYACTCTTSDQSQFQFARPASLPGVCAIGGRRCSLPASAATSFDNEQMLPGSKRGARSFVSCRATPVRAFLLRVRGFSLTSRGRVGSGAFSQFAGAESGCSRPLAKVDHPLRNRASQSLAKGNSHFQNLRIYDPQAICGEVVSAQFHDGEIQNV